MRISGNVIILSGVLLGLSILAITPTAQAQSPSNFKLIVGGDVFFEAGFVDQKRDDGLHSTEFRNRFRLVVTPSAKADNGLEYGARLRLRASNADRTTDADRAFLFAQGAFGILRAGVVNGFDDEVHQFMQTPLDWRLISLHNEPFAYIGGSSSGGAVVNGVPAGADLPFTKAGFDWDDFNAVENSATKVAYYSPRIAGFQFGVDFTPRNDSSQTDVNRSKLGSGSATATANYQNLWEAGINYDGKFGDVGFRAFGAAIIGSATDTVAASYHDLRAVHVGGQVTLGVWSVGAGYMDFGKSGLSKAPAISADRTRNINAGFQYNSGGWAAGFQYQYGQDAGNPAVPGKRSVNAYTGGAMHTLAPGLAVGGEYTWFQSRSDIANRDDRGSVILLHTGLSF